MSDENIPGAGFDELNWTKNLSTSTPKSNSDKSAPVRLPKSFSAKRKLAFKKVRFASINEKGRGPTQTATSSKHDKNIMESDSEVQMSYCEDQQLPQTPETKFLHQLCTPSKRSIPSKAKRKLQLKSPLMTTFRDKNKTRRLSSLSYCMGFEDFESDEDEDLMYPDKPTIASTSNEVIVLYAFIGDLKKGFKANDNIALWRRDGPTLLQKFIRDKSKSDQTLFTSAMSFSTWEDHRKHEFIQIFVKPVSESKTELCVKILDVESVEQTCVFGKFHELDLDPYMSHADRKKKEEMTNADTDDYEEMETS